MSRSFISPNYLPSTDAVNYFGQDSPNNRVASHLQEREDDEGGAAPLDDQRSQGFEGILKIPDQFVWLNGSTGPDGKEKEVASEKQSIDHGEAGDSDIPHFVAYFDYGCPHKKRFHQSSITLSLAVLIHTNVFKGLKAWLRWGLGALVEETKRILVVDDDEAIRKYLRRILEMEGYRADTAGTGREALQKAKQYRYDLALLNYRLPDMTSEQLQAQMHARTPQLKIVVLGATIIEREKLIRIIKETWN